MEFKGTKGKWEVNPKALRNVKCNGIAIANCSAGQSGDKEEEEIANAKLIESALEMFEMLKKIRHKYLKAPQRVFDEIDEILTKITE